MSLKITGQSLWLDHAAREIIYDESLIRYIEDWSITGLSLSSQAVCQALQRSDAYDRVISIKIKEGLCGEALAFALILEDIRHAADLLRHVFDKTDGVDGWVAIPASPLKFADSKELKKSITDLHAKINRPNVLITVPGFPEHSELIQDLVLAGIPITIALICSHDQYLKATEAYLQGIEKRINAGINPAVSVFVSISISHLTEILSEEMNRETAAQVSVAVARKIYRSMRVLHTSQKWERVYNVGARLLRPIWVNSIAEQTTSSEHFVANHLVAPLTVTSMSLPLLNEFTHTGQPQEVTLENGKDCDEVLTRLQENGLDQEHVAARLQKDLTEYQIKMWIMMLDMLARKSASIIQNAI